MRTHKGVLVRAAAIALAASALTALTISCDSGGGGGATGNSTIMGNVVAFRGTSGAFVPAPPRGLFARVAGAALDLVVPSAWADLEGVTVAIPDLGLDSITAEDGVFVITGVPAGTYDVLFSYQGQTATVQITVPENAIVELRNVEVEGDQINLDNIEVTLVEDDGTPESDQTVVICHRPPGNPDNAQTITIGAPARDAHIAHGDTDGPCPQDPPLGDDDDSKGNGNGRPDDDDSVDDDDSLDDEESVEDAG